MKRRRCAVIFHFAPRRTTRSGYVNCLNANLRQSPRCTFAEAPADLFGDDWHTDTFAHYLNLRQQVFEVAVAFRLHGLLQCVEMQNQRVSLDHLHGTFALIDAVAVVELHRTEIGK